MIDLDEEQLDKENREFVDQNEPMAVEIPKKKVDEINKPVKNSKKKNIYTVPKVNYVYVDTNCKLDQMINHLEQKNVVAFDTEVFRVLKNSLKSI